MSKDQFEHIIQQKFEGAASDVPVNAWAGVSSQIGGSAGASGFISTVLGKIAAGVAIVGVLTTMLVIVLQKEEFPILIEPEKTAEIKEETPINITPEKESAIEELDTEPVIKAQSPDKKKTETSGDYEKKTDSLVDETNGLENGGDSNSESEISQGTESESFISDENYSDGSETTVQRNDEISEKSPSTIEEETPVVTLPQSIVSREVNKKNKRYSYRTNVELGKSYSIKWFVNDEFEDNSSEISQTFIEDGDQLIMARIYQNHELVKTLYYTQRIELLPVLVVPNVFSPYSSIGFNDVFDIDQEKSKNIDWHRISIHSADQESVFISTDNQIPWDGSMNGNPAPVGTYFYTIEYRTKNGLIQLERGIVTLQR